MIVSMEDKRYQLDIWNICVYTSDKKMSPVVNFYESWDFGRRIEYI